MRHKKYNLIMKTKKYLCIWQASKPSQTVKHRLASFTLQIIGKPIPLGKKIPSDYQ